MAPATEHAHRSAAFRISVFYLSAGLLWILLTDLYLLVAGYQNASGFQAAVSKGSLFVVLSAALVYWLVSRDYSVILKSISEQSRIGEQLRAREAQLQTMADAIPQIVWIADTQGNLTHLNQKACDYSGLAADNLSGWLWENVVHPDDLPNLHRQWTEVLRTGIPADLEFRIRRKDGHYRWHIGRQVPSRDAQQRIEMWYGTCTDIEDRKQAETTILQERQLLRTLIDSIPDLIYVKDCEGRFVIGNQPLMDFVGVRETHELAGKTVFDLFTPDYAHGFHAVDLQVLQHGEPVLNFEDAAVDASGKRSWRLVNKVPLKDPEGKTVGLVGISRDIQSWKERERLLVESQERLQLAMSAAEMGWWDWDLKTNEVTRSPECLKILEAADLPPVPGSFLKVVHSEDRERVESSLQRVIDERNDFSMEFRVVGGSGEIRWISDFGRAFCDESGTVARITGLTQHITDRKMAEQTLRASKVRLRLFLDHVPAPIAVFNRNMEYLYVSRRWKTDFQLDDRELTGLSHYEIFPQIPERWREIHGRCLAGAVEHCAEDRFERPDGSVQWLRWEIRPWMETESQIGGIIIFSEDITERKQSESAIRDRETLLGIVTESAQVGLAVANSRFEYRFVNKAYADIFGRPVTAFSGTRISDMRAEAWPELRPRLERALSGEHVSYEMQMHGVESESSPRWFRVFLSPQAGNDDDRSVVGVIVDITEQKNAERVLRDSEQRYRQLVEALPSAIFIHLDHQIVVCNPAFLTIVGAASPDDVIGRSSLEIIAESDYQKIQSRLESNSVPGTEASGSELRITRLDGRTVPVYAVAIHIAGPENSGTLVVLHDLTDAERSLHLLHSVLDSVQDAIITIDERSEVQSVNPAVEQLFGYSPPEMIGRNIVALMPEPYKTMHAEYVSRQGSENRRRFIGTERELSGRRKDGSEFPMLLTVTEFQLEGKTHYTGVVRDITDKKRLEYQFHEAQKMEAVGRLAGGVAHDFNNLLTVISGYSDLLLATMPDRDPNRESVAAIREAGERAARLTQQLLAFSRRAIIEPRILDLSGLVADSAALLRRVIGEDVLLTVETASTNARIKADPGQIEQVIMNLIVNARDAMPTGGRLRVSTKLIFIAEPKMPVDAGPAQGAYMELSVSDSGHGIPSDILPRIFDPFFTTKAVGKGTGLGLAVAHGVVKQCGGHIFVDSIVGTGTTFRVIFPVTRESSEESPDSARNASASGMETVLLVEDEDAVRQIARIALESRGFKVLEASNGQAAIQMSHEYLDTIDVVVTDVVMPEISGRQLVDAIRLQRPGLRALYMSGYMDDSIVHHGVVTSKDAFIRKPFTPFTLARKVRNVLETGK